MSTLEQLEKLLFQDLHELQHLRKRGWRVWPMDRLVKEEHVGRCCYLAEELLSSAELQALKEQLGLDDRQWHQYKVKISRQ